jgi:multiple sugar transport system substrate-binding protein
VTDKQDKSLSRRQFLILGGQGVVAAAFLASCGAQPAAPAEAPADSGAASGGEQAEPAQAPIELEFLAWGDPADLEAWDKLKAMYEEQNPNVTINITGVADPNNNFYPKLQTAVAGGTPPAVSSFQGWEWQIYADNNVLAPIDDYIARDGFTDPYPEDIASVQVSTRRNDKYYLVPLQLGTMVLFYAKKPFDDAGLDYPTDNMKLAEFIELAEKVTNTGGDNKMFGLQANGSWFRDIQWIRSTGKQEFDEIIDPTKAQFNQPEIVEMLQMMAYDVYHTMNISPPRPTWKVAPTPLKPGTWR